MAFVVANQRIPMGGDRPAIMPGDVVDATRWTSLDRMLRLGAVRLATDPEVEAATARDAQASRRAGGKQR